MRAKNLLKFKIKSQSGQAAAEMAIFGSLILLCFSVLLTYGQRLDGQQQVKMEAFRRALQKAYQRNSSVSYTLKKDVKFYNLLGGFGEGQDSALSSTASVMWQKGMSGKMHNDKPRSLAYYHINDALIGAQYESEDYDPVLPTAEKTTIGYDGSETDMQSPLSVWKEDGVKVTQYITSDSKHEEGAEGVPGRITNTQNSSLAERSDTKLYYRFDHSEANAGDDVTVPDYSGAYYVDVDYWRHGAYFNQTTNRVEYSANKVGNIITRQKTWQTDY